MFNNKSLCLVVLLGLASAAFGQSVRFVNALEGATVDVHTSELDTVHLTYMECSSYTAVTGGQIHVTNVVDSNTGNSYTNGQSLLITFNFDATVAIVTSGGEAVLALYNETAPSTVDPTKSWIRVIDLATSSEFVNFATVEGTFAAYVGPMVVTQYQSVSTSDNVLRVFDSATGSYNSPMVSVPITLSAANAYTAFYFTPTTGPAANYVYDHTFSGAAGSSTSSSTGISIPSSSTSGSETSTSTSGVTETSASTSAQPVVIENSSAQVGVFAVLSIVAALLAL